MNERIRELAKQARQIGEYVNYGQIRLSPGQFEQKFAELIVRECMEACSRANDIRYFVPPTQEQVVLSCMREIETTFLELKNERTN